MRQNKKLKLHSDQDEKTDKNEGSSCNLEIVTSSQRLDSLNQLKQLAGRIDSIQMINFMCHSNLEINFKNRITFVTGQNGSGKSTIMAALVVVLGGTASVTGRGNKLSDFIRKGERWARVELTLVNEGVNAYKEDVYGDRIIISRDLSVQTGSSYSCKSKCGRVISNKKEEIDKICTALDIQIKNPICILNQDVARTFLSSADSRTRFTMFMEATHLEDIKLIYSNALESLQSAQNQLATKKLSLEEADKEINQLREKLERFISLEKKELEKTSLENELLWSLVISEEKLLQCLLKTKSEIEGKKKNFEKCQSKIDEVIENLNKNVHEVQENLSNLRSGENCELSDNKSRKKCLQVEIQSMQRKIDACNAQIEKLLWKSKRQQSDINNTKNHLKESEEMANRNVEEDNKIKENMKNLCDRLSEVKARIVTTQRDNDGASETKVRYEMTLEKLNSELNNLELMKRKIEMPKERNSNVANDPLSKIGPFAPKLKQLIDEAAKRNQFVKKPIGPCCLYVTLTGDPKWARAVESAIGGLMNTYCCDNQKDFQVLSGIMESVCGGKMPPIILSKFQNGRHDVSAKKVSVRGLNTVLDVLHISNDVVFNTFIDRARLETILLFETDAEASSLLSHIQNVPKNLRMGLTLQSDQYYPAPNYRTYFGNANRPLKYFDFANKEKSAVERHEKEVREAELRIKEKKMEIAELKTKYLQITEFLKKTTRNLGLLKENERKLEAEINELKGLKESTLVLPTKLVLEEELDALMKKEEEVQKDINEERMNMGKLSKEKEEKVRTLNEITEKENKMQSECEKLQEKLDDLKYKIKLESSKKKDVENDCMEAETELKKIEEEIAQKRQSLKEKTQAAEEVHPERINTKKSPAAIQEQLEKCEKYLKAAEGQLGSAQSVRKEYNGKYEKYKAIKSEVDDREKIMNNLIQKALSKKEKFKLLQSHTANLVSFHFQSSLKTRDYNGSLKFDFHNQTLEMDIIPKDGLLRSDTKTLSGGERSYLMVSFILAIWRAVQMPFYFLDEFDVFMDKMNRKVIIDLLVEHGKNEKSKQFIFITPQDTSIRTCDVVSIYKMPAPRKRSL